MDLALITQNTQMIVALCAALAVFSAIVVVAWPYLARRRAHHPHAADLKRARAHPRARARQARGAEEAEASLRVEPKKFFKDIVDRFNLARQAEDGHTVKMLRQAGYRGQNPVFVFLSLRLIMPLVMFAIAVLYVFFVIRLEQPFMLKLAITLVIAYLGYYGAEHLRAAIRSPSGRSRSAAPGRTASICF